MPRRPVPIELLREPTTLTLTPVAKETAKRLAKKASEMTQRSVSTSQVVDALIRYWRMGTALDAVLTMLEVDRRHIEAYGGGDDD